MTMMGGKNNGQGVSFWNKFRKRRPLAPLGAGSLADCLAFVSDPRLDRTKKHALCEILFTAVCASLCGCLSCYDMEDFCRDFLPWLRLRVPLAGGAPSHETFRRVLGLVDPRHVAFGLVRRPQEMVRPGLRRDG